MLAAIIIGLQSGEGGHQPQIKTELVSWWPSTIPFQTNPRRRIYRYYNTQWNQKLEFCYLGRFNLSSHIQLREQPQPQLLTFLTSYYRCTGFWIRNLGCICHIWTRKPKRAMIRSSSLDRSNLLFPHAVHNNEIILVVGHKY